MNAPESQVPGPQSLLLDFTRRLRAAFQAAGMAPGEPDGVASVDLGDEDRVAVSIRIDVLVRLCQRFAAAGVDVGWLMTGQSTNYTNDTKGQQAVAESPVPNP
jgi:hypothetical protein